MQIKPRHATPTQCLMTNNRDELTCLIHFTDLCIYFTNEHKMQECYKSPKMREKFMPGIVGECYQALGVAGSDLYLGLGREPTYLK